MSKDLFTAIEEMDDLLSMVSETFYTHLSFNRDKAITTVSRDGMNEEEMQLTIDGVNAGVRATLSTIDELRGEIRFRTRGITATITGNLVRGMFDDINS